MEENKEEVKEEKETTEVKKEKVEPKEETKVVEGKDIKEETKVEVKPKKKNKLLMFILTILVVLGITIGVILLFSKPKVVEEQLKVLPKPEITSGQRGELGIDKNINESNIDEYLGRPDAVYRDMRLLEDPAEYENIGGDRFLSGYIKGFEVIPLPYIIPVEDLPEEVGDTYVGNTLFHLENDSYIPNYEESVSILEKIFPKDKVIFLMCGGGGYAGMTRSFLISMGWDENKIYNVGGFWYYKGKNKIDVPKKDGKYDFSNVPYHEINFDKLTKADNYQTPKVKPTEIKLNTNTLEIEVDTSFKLSAIVLPNEAYKEIKWSSSDEKIATVSEDGTVKGITPGTATITVKSAKYKVSSTCKVTILKKNAKTHVTLDDMSNEIATFIAFLDEIKAINEEFLNTFYNKRELGGYEMKEEYKIYDDDGTWYGKTTQAFRDGDNKRDEEEAKVYAKRAAYLNSLLDQKKTFILLIDSYKCSMRKYSVHDAAEKLFKEYNIQYFPVGEDQHDGDTTLINSKLDKSKLTDGSVVIIKEGQIFGMVDPDKDNIKSDEDTKNWLSKYIDLE